MGCTDPTLAWMQWSRIKAAVCRTVADDHGFPKASRTSQFKMWMNNFQSGVIIGDTAHLAPHHKCRTSVTNIIERDNSGYLHELYRYSISTLGVKFTFQEMADIINEISQSPNEVRPDLKLHYKLIYRWWKDNGGSEKSAFGSPRLTDEHMVKRVEWVKKWGEIFLDEDTNVVYLDGKRFYTTTRRKKVKHVSPWRA